MRRWSVAYTVLLVFSAYLYYGVCFPAEYQLIGLCKDLRGTFDFLRRLTKASPEFSQHQTLRSGVVSAAPRVLTAAA